MRKPGDRLMVTLALLFNPSTTPLENSFLALNRDELQHEEDAESKRHRVRREDRERRPP